MSQYWYWDILALAGQLLPKGVRLIGRCSDVQNQVYRIAIRPDAAWHGQPACG